MTRPRLLIDNDILLLLGGCGLLEDAIAGLGFVPTDCLRLPTLPHIVRKGKSLHTPLDEAGRVRVLDLCSRIPALDEASNPTLAQRLTDAKEIDAGEVILFAALVEHPAWLLTTGDKRALRTLACTDALADLRAAITGRIVCLETILLNLMRQTSPAALGERLRPVRESNKVLRAVFSDGNMAKPDECEVALRAYSQQLVNEVGFGFLFEG